MNRSGAAGIVGILGNAWMKDGSRSEDEGLLSTKPCNRLIMDFGRFYKKDKGEVKNE